MEERKGEGAKNNMDKERKISGITHVVRGNRENKMNAANARHVSSDTKTIALWQKSFRKRKLIELERRKLGK